MIAHVRNWETMLEGFKDGMRDDNGAIEGLNEYAQILQELSPKEQEALLFPIVLFCGGCHEIFPREDLNNFGRCGQCQEHHDNRFDRWYLEYLERSKGETFVNWKRLGLTLFIPSGA